jgi:hypothetical protein
MRFSKYRAKKTIVNGIMFDSKREADRYATLLLLEKSGRIKDLKLQPTYELIPRFIKNGKTYRKTTYKADFEYFDTKLNKIVVEDVKGFKTDVYKLKKKMFEHKYEDLEIEEVK